MNNLLQSPQRYISTFRFIILYMTAPNSPKKKHNVTIQYKPGNMITVITNISNNDLSTEQQKTLHTIYILVFI